VGSDTSRIRQERFELLQASLNVGHDNSRTPVIWRALFALLIHASRAANNT